MILFNWEKIVKRGKYNPNKVLKLFYYLTHDVKITSLRDPMAPLILEQDYSGSSFLINPKPIYSSIYRDLERLEYIALAALRNYTDYRMYGVQTLNPLFSPLERDRITDNKLLTLEANQITFKYEEK